MGLIKNLLLMRDKSGAPSSQKLNIQNVVVSQDSKSVSVTMSIMTANEDNLPPTIDDVYLTGTFEVGTQITLTGRGFFSRSGYPAGSHIYTFYRATDNKGTSEVQVQSSTSPNYTLVAGDDGKYIRGTMTPVQSGGLNTTGQAVSSLYTVVTDPAFNPYIDIPFSIAMDWSTTTDLVNHASGTPKDANATTTTNAPTFDAAKNSNRFTRSTNSSAVSNGYKIQASANFTAAPEEYLEFITPTSFSGTQGLRSLSGTHQVQCDSTGLLFISGTSTGVTLSANTRYVLYIYQNGTSSLYNLNFAGDIAISLSANAIGTPNIRIGSQFADTNYWNGWVTRYFLIRSRLLTSGEKASMKTYFGF